ncbi:methyltransferase domain-containing protein [Azospirillum sp. RWY-5-1]|uniref:Methyltransferase domain-containing protein n=1 Tax=Azospirillum oleiclasticum TaxID=2735135 RepID=A0ABX2TBK3_9PROT|nr:methyltransferase domain-containing protein [Azospirillum oleiclasticum]NYZ14220.1 methyltransferase domain-containing protein [Azospirillum oleiclasticum]NYZ21704.1 methyltransferase domain-containing protein [Azospirillum oleiclasticum]
MTGQNHENESQGPSLKTKLKAWWEGYDLSARNRRAADEAPPPTSAPAPAKPAVAQPGVNRWGKPLWSANRIQVAEQIWGQGFSTPGGADHVPYLVRPLGLNPAMSVLDLSAGLGGTSRAMAAKFGCWVTGLEASPLLAKAGMERSFMAGLAKQAPIEAYDPENFSFARRVDAVFYKEGMFTVAGKDQMFDGIEVHLKPRGHVLITDYILAPGAKLDDLTAWHQHEPQEPHLWTKEEFANAFAQRNLDLRIAEDITDTHRGLILTAIQRLVEHMEKHHLDHETKMNVMDEVELWVRRVNAMERGLRCFRFYALKPPE